LLDLELPDLSGEGCVGRFRAAQPEIKILILSVHDTPEWLFPALSAGADGYLVKPPEPTELLDALDKVHAGGAAMSASIARRVLEVFRKPAPAQADFASLTPAEETVLRLVAQGYSNKEIGRFLDISPRTVEGHLGHIYRKLPARTRADAAVKWTQANRPAGKP
jgi:DNA-binding NarL/FixJ family response regulator